MGSETPYAQLRRLIFDGMSPADASVQVMSDLPARWRDWVYPFVYNRARGVETDLVNHRMRAAFGRDGGGHREAAQIRLANTVYKLPDGTRVLWADMTVEWLDLKIAQLRKQIGSLVDHLQILEAARKLCADRGVNRLGDIDGWEQLVGAAVASGDMVDRSGVTARKPQTSTATPVKARRGRRTAKAV